MPRKRLPALPELLSRKIYKTGQTRGADDDVIFQNRVGRNNTVLIPYEIWKTYYGQGKRNTDFEKGFIVLISPQEYFDTQDIDQLLAADDLEIGRNCLVFYETRADWDQFNPENNSWIPARNRENPLGGQFVARVPATTAAIGGEQIRLGFTETALKGAGIRLYEYASTETMKNCRLQLEALYWHCEDAFEVAIENGMSDDEAATRRDAVLEDCEGKGLLDYAQLTQTRMLNAERQTICPLCLLPLSGRGFFSRLAQAEGRDVPDLTVTEINLFHIDELKYGALNHRPYNLGWGHHHCNVVTKDSGIEGTIIWMKEVLARNEELGH